MNKINTYNAILINSVREIDYYNNLIKNFPKNFFTIILNDYINQVNYVDMKNKIQSNSINFKYELYSSIINHKIKYNYLISTGLGHYKKITIKSLIIFSYAQTIGVLINFFNLGNVFKKILSRSLTMGGKLRTINESKLLEKNISRKTILFPRGLDMHISAYPEKYWIKTFDFFCCHGELDKKLLLNKNIKLENILKIGYPRYEQFLNSKKSFKKINFKKYDNNKKTILWMPTHINFPKSSIGSNIFLWQKYCETLTKNYNVIIRPHPKTLPKKLKEINLLQKKGFLIDYNKDRSLGNLYNMADLVIADYGGSIFSSIFMNKKILLLNLPINHPYFIMREKNMTLDQLEREKISSLDLNNGKDLLRIVELMLKENINYNRNLYFNDNDNIKNFKNKFFKNI